MKPNTKRIRPSSPDFRPASYWKNDDPLDTILQNIKGIERRRIITKAWNEGRVEDLNDVLLEDTLDEETRFALGRISPLFLGGEFLPDFLPGEVEIATIHVASVTSDVVSIRARRQPGDDLVHYRIVDEYPKSNKFRYNPKNSELPFTFAEMIRFIDHASDNFGHGLGLCYTEYNYADFCYDDSIDLEEFAGFTGVSSQFYPALGGHYSRVQDKWFKDVLAERAEREEQA